MLGVAVPEAVSDCEELCVVDGVNVSDLVAVRLGVVDPEEDVLGEGVGLCVRLLD